MLRFCMRYGCGGWWRILRPAFVQFAVHVEYIIFSTESLLLDWDLPAEPTASYRVA